jgi:hypothetical protein
MKMVDWRPHRVLSLYRYVLRRFEVTGVTLP